MQKYLITSEEHYTRNSVTFSETLYKNFIKHMPEYALFRDKENPAYDLLAIDFMKVCNQFKSIKSFIHQDVSLAKKLNATGVHLSSKQFHEISNARDLGLEVIVSTHTHKEVLEAQNLGANIVTYSPIFLSPNKGEPKGVRDLMELSSICSISIFALGGVVDELHIEKLRHMGVFGFASIRYFY